MRLAERTRGSESRYTTLRSADVRDDARHSGRAGGLRCAWDPRCMIELKGVSKSYGGSIVLAKLDLTIAAGRTAVLIGPSGCGKSTLLRLMIGLVPPDTGSVAIAGTELDSRRRRSKSAARSATSSRTAASSRT